MNKFINDHKMKNYEHEFYVTRKCTKYEYFTVRANSMEEAKEEAEFGFDYYDFDLSLIHI